jgi:hypothetical protein
VAATLTVTSQVQQAMADLLAAQLPLSLLEARGCTYLFEAEEPKSFRCPAIFIFDKGYSVVKRTNSGMNPDGTLVHGTEQRHYLVDLQVWMTGRQAHELRTSLRQWNDHIAAIVETNWTLGGYPVVAYVERGSEPASTAQGSSTYMVMEVQCAVDVWMARDATAITAAS